MDVKGEYTFDAPRDIVWNALRDIDVLAQVMPGGEGFAEVAENEYTGNLKIKVGPVQGKFKGDIKLTDIVEPESYNIQVDGKGAPGFVRATGGLQLTDNGETTHMEYEGKAQIGGRIASVGQRLMDTSAKSIIRQSLEALNEYCKFQVAKVAAESAAPAAVASLQDEVAEKVAPVEVPTYTPPSQAELAAAVAKDVASEIISPTMRNVLIGVGVVVVLALIYIVAF